MNNVAFDKIHYSEEPLLPWRHGFVAAPTWFGFCNLQYCVRRDTALVLTSQLKKKNKKEDALLSVVMHSRIVYVCFKLSLGPETAGWHLQ